MSQTPQSWRKLSAPFALAALALLALSAAGSSGAPAATGLLPAGAVAPTAQQRMLAPRIAGILEQNHYRHIPIDRQLSPLVYQHFLTTLDGQHNYFLAGDITGFERWKYEFGDMIHTGQLDPAYLIFNVFQQRNRERIAYALKLLDTEPNWDTNESLTVDRTHATWPATEEQMDELWRLRVKNDAISLMLTGKTWPQAAETLRKRYQSVLRRIGEVSPEDVFEALMNSYCAAYDPHSNYFSPRSSEEYRIQMSLSYQGIGASLGQTDDYVTVTGVLPGGPAAADGTLKPNDRITAVAQGATGPLVDIIGWRLDDVVQLIRGKEGTVVRLQILPAGATPGTPERMLSLTRNKVTLQNQAPKKEVHEVMRNGRTYKIGVITVPNFYNDMEDAGGGNTTNRSTTNDVRRLLQQLAAAGGVDALVLDLRSDGGGYLPEAIGLTHLFTNHGPVVQLRDTTGQLEVLDQPDSGQAYSGPLSVLVDRTSASASEIFAGAIQDYHRGLIIGQTTFGKGTVQSVIPLDRWSSQPVEGQVTVTIGKFYRVTGESTQLRGVTPDLMLPSPISLTDVGESVMDNALPWDRIASVPFRALPPFGSLVQTLAAEQSERAMHNSDYQWLLASLAVLDEARQEKTLSLNLKVREQQRTMQDQTRLVEENLRRSAHGLPALKSVADIEATDEPDVVLTQAVDIMADDVAAHAGLPATPAPQLQQARRAPLITP
ncbi:MAG TPA: carboxy terminal-processing peptidase [Steroidobacteraceae bacterium]|jgi:carboxyl-terminal processing protease|nr:carboxy terminal-processing peptidase [Steroidobacteraceae bacterium]